MLVEWPAEVSSPLILYNDLLDWCRLTVHVEYADSPDLDDPAHDPADQMT